MRRQRIEILIQAITRAHRDTIHYKPLAQFVHHRMGEILRTCPELQYWYDFGEWIDRDPEPEHMSPATQPCAQFVELDMREVQVAEDTVVQARAMFTGTGQPGRYGRRAMAKNPRGSCDI
jgi:hypothetical protein